MRNLLDFLVRYNTWFVFAFYVILSCMLLFQSNPYQHYVYLTSAGRVASTIYEGTSNVSSYFHLRDINEDLQRRNADLEREVISLSGQIQKYRESIYADSMKVTPPLDNFSFIIAHVINNSITRPYNYITISKGEVDSIKPEMGVVDQNGVVGIVNVVGPHTARIISILNPNLRLSCKVKGSDYFGSLVWDGKSYEEAVLEEMPKHVKFKKGDTIVTSGYSAVFPAGIPVGIIESHEKEHNDNFYSLRIKLLTDFAQLSTVRVIGNRLRPEVEEVEKDDLSEQANKTEQDNDI